MAKQVSLDKIRFAPSILARLGEELVPNFDQGLMELVRNAYDADAFSCSIELACTGERGGRVIIRDNGKGMTTADIRTGWLVIGKSKKERSQVTGLGRIPIGDKGLGRLAALRMGQFVVLMSYPETRPGSGVSNKVVQVFIDWDAYDRARLVDDVNIEIQTTRLPESTESGTVIVVDELHEPISKKSITQLARNLSLLANPFEEVADFSIKLEAPGDETLEKIVREGYLDDREYRLTANLRDKKTISIEVTDSNGQKVWVLGSDDWAASEPNYQAPDLTFELNIFILNSQSFSTRSSSVSQVRKWLRSVGGVHFYYHNFRVHPYGEPGHDWLDMNLARARSPELRPSTNTAIGRVIVANDREGLLQQKTDRLGFIENEAFLEVRRFCIDVLDWLAAKRLKARDQAIQQAKTEADNGMARAKDELDSIINNELPSGMKDRIKKAVEELEKESIKKERHYQEDLQLYRSLATAGTATVVFSHEIGKPLSEIPKIIKSIDSHVNKSGDAQLIERYKKRSKNILGYLERLGHFAKLQLNLLKRSKRRSGRVNVHEVINDVVDSYAPMLSDAHIGVDLELNGDNVGIHGTVTLFEAILTNCLTNCVRAFQMESAEIKNRRILIRTVADETTLTMNVEDNGPGIKGISRDEIWLPGKTTAPDGTGFGLTIVRDSVRDLGGTAKLRKPIVYDGANFEFVFPLLR